VQNWADLSQPDFLPNFYKFIRTETLMAKTWRVSPPEHPDREVHQLALAENRSD
jgi:hypothetical protein